MGKIYIASKPVAGIREHLYLVYDPDTNPNNGNERVIRGGPFSTFSQNPAQIPDPGNIFIDINRNLNVTDDRLESGETPATQNFTELSLPAGETAETLWGKLVNHAKTYGVDLDGDGRFDTGQNYEILGTNSNATIFNVLKGVGIDPYGALPKLNGTGPRLDASEFTGYDHQYTSGNAPQTINLTDPRVKSYTDGNNGATTFQIGPGYLQSPHYNGQPIRLIADNNAASLDKIVLNGFNPSDILARRMTDGSLRLFFKDPATGELKALVDVPNAFDGIAGNDFNSLDVIAPNGTLTKIPLSNLSPAVFPLNYMVEPGTLGLTPLPSNPIDLPTWLTGGVGPGYAAGEGVMLPRWGFGGGPGCPLILDLDGDGVETVKLGFEAASRSTVYFDLNNDGVKERTAWVGKDDGLLALDRNNNGKIDNKDELFGNNGNFLDGFAQLRTLDTNKDGKITIADSPFSLLRVWKDANSNGITDTGELVTLSSLNITSIALNATVLTDTYNNENWVSHRASYQLANGTTRAIEDVWFRFDGADTVRADAPVTLNPRVLFLPTLKGTGILKDLHVAMSADANLLSKVESFALAAKTASFGQKAVTDAQVEAILYRWAGVENVDPTSRGGSLNANVQLDARKLMVMEQMLGDTYFNASFNTSNVPPQAVGPLLNAWSVLVGSVKAALYAQTPGIQGLFTTPGFYNLIDGNMAGTPVLNMAKIATLSAEAQASGNAAQYWSEFAKFLGPIKAFEMLNAAELSALQSAVAASGPGLSWQSVIDTVNAESLSSISNTITDYFAGSYRNENYDGGAGDDVIYGGGGQDGLSGGSGNDLIYGGTGNDFVHGNAGNDRLYGDAGNDLIEDGDGHDTVYAGAGDDTVQDQNGNDVVYLGDGNDTFTYQTRYYPYVVPHDGNDTVYGEAGNDTIISGTGNDILDGGSGDDTITDYAGDNTLIGGAGNDTLTGYGGANTYVYASGHDVIRDYKLNTNDAQNMDIIRMDAGILAADVTLARNFVSLYNQSALTITIRNKGTITVPDQFNNPTYGTDPIDKIVFANEAEINLATVQIITRGTAGDDQTIYGALGPNTTDLIYGYAGHDRIFAGDGNDIAYGGDGHDVISGENGNDRLHGENGNDNIYGDAGADTLYGGPGDDVLYGEYQWEATGGADALYGDSGNDQLYSYAGDDTQSGGTGDDYLYDTLGNNTFDGGDGNDTLIAGSGNDRLTGGRGTDQMDGGGGNDVYIFGTGAGADTITEYSGGTDQIQFTSSSITASSLRFERANLDLNIYYGTSDKLTIRNQFNLDQNGYGLENQIESIRFYNGTTLSLTGPMTFTGTNAAETLQGTKQNDTLSGLGGNDYFYGGAGNDVLIGGVGADYYWGDSGADTFRFTRDGLDGTIDRVADFNTAQLDKIDLKDLLVGYDPLTKAITDFVEFTSASTNTNIRVDRDGAGTTYSWQHIATLDNITGLTDEAALRSNGTLIV